ncbi:MAG TPA: MFS transporter [Chloroflexota bacterium]|nr:MFS transporter [Chloroflexota bacterium]
MVFAVVYFCSLIAPFNQFKVPPLIPVLIQDLQISEVQAGLLMSVFAVSGAILALPAGLLYRRYGPTFVGTVAVASAGIGSAIGALSADPSMLLAGRLIEGTGMGMTAVVAIATVAAWFPPERRTIPMAILTTWIPVGQSLILAIAPRVYLLAGWRAVWWLGAVVALLAAALFAWLVRLPVGSTSVTLTARASSMRSALREPGPWWLAIFFSTFHMARAAFGTWTPTYLVNEAGFSLQDAATTVSLFYLASIPAALPGGWLIERIGSRKRAYIAVSLASIPAYAAAYVLDPRLVGLFAVWTGLCAAVVPTAVNGITPETVRDPTLVGPAVGVVAIGRNGGQLLAPVLVAPIIAAHAPWGWVGGVVVVLLLAGIAAGSRVGERGA